MLDSANEPPMGSDEASPDRFPERWPVEVRYGGRDLRRLSVRGVLLMVLTVGLYRFWFVSDLRRFFWSRTIINGSPLEYTGRGLELFIGFLIAVAILLPFALVLFGLSLVSQQAVIIGNILYFVILSFLGQYALYRARRYRLNRTVWRGLRLHLTGSAWKYAFLVFGWAIAGILTLGIAWPWASASLERFRVNNTWYGNLRFNSKAKWSNIAKPYAVIWLFLILPVLVLSVLGGIISGASELAENSTILPDNVATMVPLILGLSAFVPLFGVFIYPWYKAVVMRTYFSRIRAGSASLVADFSTGLLYKIWFKTIAAMIAATTVLSVAGGLVYLALLSALPEEIASNQLFLIVLSIIGYVSWIAVNYVITITMYNFGIWREVGNSMVIANPESILDAETANRDNVGGVNEGFADALDVGGGFEIGL